MNAHVTIRGIRVRFHNKGVEYEARKHAKVRWYMFLIDERQISGLRRLVFSLNSD